MLNYTGFSKSIQSVTRISRFSHKRQYSTNSDFINVGHYTRYALRENSWCGGFETYYDELYIPNWPNNRNARIITINDSDHAKDKISNIRIAGDDKNKKAIDEFYGSGKEELIFEPREIGKKNGIYKEKVIKIPKHLLQYIEQNELEIEQVIKNKCDYLADPKDYDDMITIKTDYHEKLQKLGEDFFIKKKEYKKQIEDMDNKLYEAGKLYDHKIKTKEQNIKKTYDYITKLCE